MSWAEKVRRFKSHVAAELIFRSFCIFPVRSRRIIFSSFQGRGFSDSPRALYEYISDNHPGYECVWVLKDTRIAVSGSARKVKFGSFAHLYFQATSKYWIANSRLLGYFKKRRQTRFLNTWHGTPYKCLGRDVASPRFAGKDYGRESVEHAAQWDLLCSAGPFSTEKFMSAFGVARERIVESGYPRNDELFVEPSSERLQELRRALGLKPDRKVLLYAPTWRDVAPDAPEGRAMYQGLQLERLRELYQDEVQLLVRAHYHITSELALSELGDFAIDVSAYPSVNDLYCVSDALITDYSSNMFDYALLARPVFLFLDDLEEYQETRGLYFDIEETSLRFISKRQADLERQLSEWLSDGAGDCGGVDGFASAFCSAEDGTACSRILRVFLGDD